MAEPQGVLQSYTIAACIAEAGGQNSMMARHLTGQTKMPHRAEQDAPQGRARYPTGQSKMHHDVYILEAGSRQ